MPPMLTRTTLAAALLAAGVDTALAHTGFAAHAAGFADGVVHPLTGLDHLAAMVAVGLWAAALGGRAVVAVPVAFVALLAAGAALAAAGIVPPAVEPVIRASVIALGLAVAFGVRLPVVPAALAVGLFGLFHGAAHGAEMPSGGALAYGAGFVTATVLLHAVGMGMGYGLARSRLPAVARAVGAGIAAFGLVLAATG